MSNLPAQPKVFPFLTVIPGRRPQQKMHTSVGHAKNAFQDTGYGRHRTGQLYKWSGEGWELLYDVPEQTETVKVQGYSGWRNQYKDTRPWRIEQEK